jgi:hypothetical protein
MARNRKARRRPGARAADPHHSSERKAGDRKTFISKFRAARTWIITAIVAGLGLSITGGVVSLTNMTADWFGGAVDVAHHNTVPKDVNVNTTAIGPVLGVQVGQGFAEPCGDGGNGWVFPKSASTAVATSPADGPTRDGQTWVSDPSAWGAVEASDVQILMLATGSSQRSILLTGIKVHVLRRRAPLQGTAVDIEPSSSSCPRGSSLPYQAETIDLDTSPVTVAPDGNGAIPAKFPYAVSESDPEAFYLSITTRHCDCAWTLELDWIAGSTSGKSIVTDNGQPFEITADVDLPRLEWSYGPNNGPWERIR